MVSNSFCVRNLASVAGIFFLCVSVVVPHRAHAEGVVLLPRVIDLEVKPRDILPEKIVVKNDSGAPVTLFTFVNNVTMGLEGGVQEFVSPSMSDRSNSLSSWIEVSRAGFDLPAGGTREIPLTVRVSSEAVPGIYHALISYASGGNSDEAFTKVQNGVAPNILVTVSIKKPSSDFIKLSSFSIKKFITRAASDDVAYALENTGDTELKPTGDILVYNQRGEEVASIPVNPQNQSIQPGALVNFTAGIQNKNLFGKYKAFLTVRYGAQQAAVYDTVYFYSFPWKKITIIFSALLVCALLISLGLHYRYARKNDDDDQGDFLPMGIRQTSSKAGTRDVVMKKL